MRARGMTLLELTISLAITSVVIGATLMAVIPVTRSEGLVSADTRLRSDARRGLQRLANDLRQTGNNVTINGLVYPHIYAPWDPVNGPDDADSGFEAYNALPPGIASWGAHDALPGDDDYGATTHVILRIPTDLDGNGTPTDQVDGSVEWTANDIAYVLVQDPATQINELRRYTDYAAGTFETVAVYVERLFIQRDDNSGAVWDDDLLSDNQDELRLTLQLRVPDPNAANTWMRGTVSTVVNMRN